MKICKLLFFADKEHLLRYGRPITGDTYYKLEHGPIPSKGLNLLRGKVGATAAASVQEYFRVVGNTVKPKRQLDMSVFSNSDVKVLEDVKQRLGTLSASKLRRLSHDEPSWKNSNDNQPMAFELFFEGHPEAETIKNLVLSEQDDRSVLAPYRAN